jgi:hypothetical protein
VARRLPEIVEEIGLRASKDHVLPIIDTLVCDDSPEVRETMMEHVLSLCAVFDSVCGRREGEEGGRREGGRDGERRGGSKDHVLPITDTLCVTILRK